MTLSLKINGPEGNSVVLKVQDDITLGGLKERVEEKTGVACPEQKYLSGFPPQDLRGDDSQTLLSLGIRSGSALTLLKKSPEEMAAAASATSNGPSSADTPEAESSIKQLVEMGFSQKVARKALEISHRNMAAAFELCIGGVVTDESLEQPPQTSTVQGVGAQAPVMVRRVVDADNSCLFNSIGLLMEKNRKTGSRLRRVIADAVRSDPGTFTAAILGKPPSEYCAWIQDDSKWGGEVELFILSSHYKVEITAVEIRTLHCYTYGEGKGYSRRIYVLYDGVHYDASAMAAAPDAPEHLDTTAFPVGADDGIKEQVIELARQLKQRRQFVDLAGCALKCLVCDRGFKGQDEALTHARVTLHQNFAQT